MFRRFSAVMGSAILLTAVFCVALFLPVKAVERGPVGIEALERLDLLPYLWQGREAKHTSSHAPDGANIDRGNYLSTSPVLYEDKGAGCVYRIWTTNQYSTSNFAPTAHGEIWIYIDDSTKPLYKFNMADFFNGSLSNTPFKFPLVGNSNESSGGFYCYVPIPYRNYCKIYWSADTSTVPPLYFNVDAIKYDSSDGVTSFTGTEDVATVLQKWQNPGIDPKPTSVRAALTNTVIVPRNGGKKILCDISGPGSISRIMLKRELGTTMTDDEWNKVRINITFDNHSSPDVLTTFGRFFGGDLHRPAPNDLKDGYERIDGRIKGLLCGADGYTGWNYNFYPMPFGTRTVIELENTQTSVDFTVKYEVYVSDMPDAARLLSTGQIGYFKTTQNLNKVNRTVSRDYNMLDEIGRGVVVGYVYTPFAGRSGKNSYLEGDERIHIDNSLTPAIYGTGTEDTFNCGWYFKQGRVSLPTHGYTTSVNGGRSLYRLLLGDVIPYNNRIKFGFECGPRNGDSGPDEEDNIEGAGMYSTVMYYSSPVPSTLVGTDDSLIIKDTVSETDYEYKLYGSLFGPDPLTSCYEGDDDTISSTKTGHWFQNGYCQFKLNIRPDNYSVKLRRTSYYWLRNQDAMVYVDGDPVGKWYDAGSNGVLSWRENDFNIPANYTQGKSFITVKLQTTAGWTEYKYQALVYVSPASAIPAAPVVTDDGSRNLSTSSLHFSWTKPNEPVWGISSYSYSIGTTYGGTDVRDWTNAGTDYSFNASGLTLQEGQTYYVNVKAKNGAGIWGSAGTSDGITALSAGGIDDAKNRPDGSKYILTDCIVTAVFNGFFYVEDIKRVSGIKIVSSDQVAEGNVIDIEGTLATVGGERQVESVMITHK